MNNAKSRKQDYSELLALQCLALRLKVEATGNLKEVRDVELSAIEARANRENAAAASMPERAPYTHEKQSSSTVTISTPATAERAC